MFDSCSRLALKEDNNVDAPHTPLLSGEGGIAAVPRHTRCACSMNYSTGFLPGSAVDIELAVCHCFISGIPHRCTVL